MSSTRPGRLVIISGPSGAGKSTVVRELLSGCSLPLKKSVSATTRAPRTGEQDHVEYHFLSRDEFARRQSAGEFLESCEVFGRGEWYGTLRSEVTAGVTAGKWVILEIDVHGAMAVLDQEPSAVSIFIRPRSIEELERRLRHRGTETDEKIARRLEVARQELTFVGRYQHDVINDTVPAAVDEICKLLTREFSRGGSSFGD